MNAVELLAGISSTGASIEVMGDRLAVNGASNLTDELRHEIRTKKRDLLDLVRGFPEDLRSWGPTSRYALSGLERHGLDRITAREIVAEAWRESGAHQVDDTLARLLVARGIEDAEAIAGAVQVAAAAPIFLEVI